MKKILLFGLLGLVIIGLQAHGACLIENIKTKEACTGGASGINNSPSAILEDEYSNSDVSDKKYLEDMYQIPTIAVPSSMRNGFPILNPAANCMYGMCQPR